MAAYQEKLSLVPYSKMLVQFFLGAFLLRGTAVTFNDICDRKLDRFVGKARNRLLPPDHTVKLIFSERTKGRPLATGAISVQAASVLLVLEILLCTVFFWSLNRPA